MRLRGQGFVIVVVALACCGALGYGAAAVAASGSSAGVAPLPAATLTAIQANVQTATKLELQAVKDLKKRSPKSIKDSQIVMRRAGTALTTALTSLDAAGFRTSTAYDSIARASNDVKVALVSHLFSDTLKYLGEAIPYQTKALTQLPGLTVAPSTSTTTTTSG